jgi:hypothetical protein
MQSVVAVVSVFSMVCLSPPVLPSVISLLSVFIATDGQTRGDKPSIEKTGTREVTDGQTGGDKPTNKY